MPDLPVSATCVRVPVLNAHAVSIMVELDKPFTLDEVREAFAAQKGIVVVDDFKNNKYPVSTIANDNDAVYVGRIRKDLSSPNGILFYCVSDNIRKGAAANAVQIAEALIKADKAQFDLRISKDSWFGVTYSEDRPMVQEALKKLVDNGAYPAGLF